jgi:hypothetical protein
MKSEENKANVPELTKEEYIRFEMAKAWIAAKPDLGMPTIRDHSIQLAEAIINPNEVYKKPDAPTE